MGINAAAYEINEKILRFAQNNLNQANVHNVNYELSNGLKASSDKFDVLVLAGSIAPLILLFGFILHFVMDKSLVGPAGLPSWYLPLRWRLTLVACLCLLLNAWQVWGLLP